MLALVALLLQSDVSTLDSAARRIADHPELARRFEERSAPFVRCGRAALERNLAVQANGTTIERMSQEQAGTTFQKAILGAARDCEIDRYAGLVSSDIRAVLPDVDQTTAINIARANLIQLIGFSIWRSDP